MIEAIVDRGQDLAEPQGRTIGYVDTKAQLDAVTNALNAAGYPDSQIAVIDGNDGIALLERQRGVFFFGDSERAVIDLGIDELQKGHLSIAVNVENRDAAVRVANIAVPNGGHTFNYFGVWVNEQLTK